MSTLAARLDRLPILPFHKKLLILVGGGMFFDAFDNYLANSVLSALIANQWSTLDLNAMFLSGTAVGMLIGSIMAGFLGDKYGRKATYQINLLIFGFASIACALAPSMHWLIFFRFLCGVGLGAELVVGYGLLGEFVPPSHRGRWGAMMSFIGQFGLFAATGASWLVIPFFGWRAMFVIAGLGGLGVYLARKNLPESPRWLSNQGREAEAEAIVQDIEAHFEGELPPVQAGPASGESAPKVVVSPWDKRFRKRVILGAITQVVQSTSIYGFVAWLPSLMVKQGISVSTSLGMAALMTLGGPCGALIAYNLTDRIGRKPAIILGSLAAAASGMAYAFAESHTSATICGFITFTLIYYLVSVIQAGYIPELFPTDVRMRLSSVCVVAGRLASIIMPFIVVFLYNFGGLVMVTSTIAVLLCFQAIMTAILGIETRNKSLEDI